MKQTGLINGLSVVNGIINAYEDLQMDVIDKDAFEAETIDILNNIINNNEFLKVSTNIDKSKEIIGHLKMRFPKNQNMRKIIENNISVICGDEGYEFPIIADLGKEMSISIEINNGIKEASNFAQCLLVSMLKKDMNINARCIDLEMGGSFYTSIHKIIDKLPERSGGKVITSINELEENLTYLEDISSKTISSLGGRYNSLYEYNLYNDTDKLRRFINIIYLDNADKWNSIDKRLELLIKNKEKNGMSFIVIGTKERITAFEKLTDYHITDDGEHFLIGSRGKINFVSCNDINKCENEINKIIKEIKSLEKVNTSFSSYDNLNGEYYSMYSEDSIKIPFAIDKNRQIKNFEIGGKASSHAAISGSTGSGKSVALHTLITQIIRNYSPNDVEIWAIDYKSVEFDWYIANKTPHFRVVAHDTSTEFSISLIDMIEKEYKLRQQKFMEAGVGNIESYRKVKGKYSMSRIVIFIDEFQYMTQAVQTYSGMKDYRIALENLFKVTRALGISFVLCSQTMASGLSGLTDSARSQIGCRLCLKQSDENESRETLQLSNDEYEEYSKIVKNLKKGQAIYKRELWAEEPLINGKAYEYNNVYILYRSDDERKELIDKINSLKLPEIINRDAIIVRGNGRIYITEKNQHPVQKFLLNGHYSNTDILKMYPASPTTLDDSFEIELDNTSGANVLLIGEDDDLRESIVVHSLYSLLMNPNAYIIASFIDEKYSDRKRMVDYLKKISTNRLTINNGISETLNTVISLRKIQPINEKRIYLWYGLEKLKNELFLLQQDREDVKESINENDMSKESLLDDVFNLLKDLNNNENEKPMMANNDVSDLSLDECKNILKMAFEFGPENNHYHFVIFNNYKSLKNSGVVNLNEFENRIGTRMSLDDSYDLFNSSLAIEKTNENTVIYYSGSGKVIPLRPYKMPKDQWYEDMNIMIRKL